MGDITNYIKGGRVLIAPIMDDVINGYVIECCLCHELFDELDGFFTHYLSHYSMKLEEDEDEFSRPEPEYMDEDSQDTVTDSEDDIALANFSNANARKKMRAVDSCLTPETAAIDDAEQSKSIEENFDENASQLSNETDDDNSEEFLVTTPSENDALIQTFKNSRNYLETLIQAFEKYPGLWNFNMPTLHRTQEIRLSYWQRIASEINESTGLQIDIEQVAALILYLYKKVREFKTADRQYVSDGKLMFPLWAFKSLKFLYPFVSSLPLAHLDIHQDLAPKQIVQVLDIFRRCPHLWDSNSIEFYCNNKRRIAVTEMRVTIAEEMQIEIGEKSLERYLRGIADYFSKQKRMYLDKSHREGTKYFKQLAFLMDHVGPFKCKHCDRTMLNPLQHRVHASQHDGSIPLRCAICDRGYKLADSYVYHIKRHMDDLNCKCKVCGRKFLRVAELTSHMRSHTGAKPFVCEICGSSFRHRTGFSQHIKRHSKNYTNFCPYCSKGFYSKDSLNTHIRTHKEDRDFECAKCGKAFKTRRTLKAHLTTHENGHHECVLCGKAFKSKVNLWQHKRKHGTNKQTTVTK